MFSNSGWGDLLFVYNWVEAAEFDRVPYEVWFLLLRVVEGEDAAGRDPFIKLETVFFTFSYIVDEGEAESFVVEQIQMACGIYISGISILT